jgi:hypothetical protein
VKDRFLVSGFYMWIAVFQAAFVEEAVFSIVCFGLFVKDEFTIDVGLCLDLLF